MNRSHAGKKFPLRCRSGFTLMGMMVAIAIIGLLPEPAEAPTAAA